MVDRDRVMRYSWVLGKEGRAWLRHLRLVGWDEYLLALTRYIHLNPVKVIQIT
jgi:hypothetical protein